MTEAPTGPATGPVRAAAAIMGVALAIAGGLFVLYRIQTVLLAVVLAVFFAYLVAPLVFATERLIRRPTLSGSTSRALAAAAVYLALLVAAATLVMLLAPRLSRQATDIGARAPEYASAVQAWLGNWIAWERSRLPADLQIRVDEAIAAGAARAFEYIQVSAVATFGVVAYLPWFVLVPVLAFFFLKDLDQLRSDLVRALPPRWRGPGYRLVQEVNTALAAYMRAQLLACLIVGITCGAVFAGLRVPYALLLGALAGVLEFVPLVGPLVTALVATLVAGVQAPVLAVWVVAFLVVLRLVQDYVIYPRLIGRGTHLHPLAIILGVLIGAELAGVVGIFLSVPALATVSVAYRHWSDWTRAGTVPDEGPELAGEVRANHSGPGAGDETQILPSPWRQ